jgi:phenylalanine-4-hydroxylase
MQPHTLLSTPEAQLHQQWAEKFQHQMRNVSPWASDAFLLGLQRVGFRPGVMPDVASLNRCLSLATGWQAELTPAWPDPRTFVQTLSEQVMPIRAGFSQHASAPPAADPNGFFEDVFGFVPLLTHPTYAQFVATAARSVQWRATASAPLAASLLYVLHYGVVREGGEPRGFGARLLSGAAGAQPLEDAILIPLDPFTWAEFAHLEPDGPRYLPIVERWEDLARHWASLLEQTAQHVARNAA